MNKFDLGEYWKRFPDALTDRYRKPFAVDVASELVFTNIGKRFEDVRSGCPLTIEHVMAIFGEDLPFVDDWTTPDRGILGTRMTDQKVTASIQRLRADFYNLESITKIWRCFRELSLTSLVLHHVYPTHFAMCSHHLASLLYITAPTVPRYYIRYCEELREWSKRARDTDGSVVRTEFALWTWHRLAHYGDPGEREKHRQAFFTDSWVQERRAKQIAESFKDGSIRPLDFARSFLDSQPIVAAMIAWREFEIAARYVVDSSGDPAPKAMWDVIGSLRLSTSEKRNLRSLWSPLRKEVIHNNFEITKEEAKKVLTGVVKFIQDNVPELR